MRILKTASDNGADGMAKPTTAATDHLRASRIVSGEEFVRMMADALKADA